MATAARKQKKSGRRDTTVNLRMPTPVRDTIDTAAEVLGKTRTAFIIESSHQHAVDVLLDQRLFSLSAGQFDAFAKALDAKPQPNAKLKQLFATKSPWER
jgi:uncharacterized protein (DUF1778 family)